MGNSKDTSSIDSGSRRSWRKLWYDVAQETTFHGVRFITQRQPYVIRRVVWAFLLLACLAGFIYITIQQLIYLWSKPKAVNVEVIFAKSLDYPTVTVCNQNFFRGSETFRLGLYDDVYDRFEMGETWERDSASSTCRDDTFRLVRGQYASLAPFPISWDERRSAGYFASFHTVTLRVCRYICVTYHDARCNAFLYLLANKTCLMTSLAPPGDVTGRWDHHVTYVHPNQDLDMYVRNRCSGVIKCDFESRTCPFYVDDDAIPSWILRSGPTGSPGNGVTRDFSHKYGHYLYVDSAPLGDMSKPTYTSHYVQASQPTCVKFAYSLRGSPNLIPSFSVSLRYGSGSEFTMWRTYDSTVNQWDVALVYLGVGLFQVKFVVESSKNKRGSAALDDITIQPCSNFVEDCRRTLLGTDYVGNVSTTSNGSDCSPWSHTPGYIYTLPDGPVNHRYCRNPDNDPRGPWCYVDEGGNYTKHYCHVPMCPCLEGEFRCSDGLCLHPLVVCDGTTDCQTKEDELTGCVVEPSCDFEEVNSCGYDLDPWNLTLKEKPTWLRHRGNMRNGNLRFDHTHGNKLGHYLYFDSGGITVLYGERVPVTSPVIPDSADREVCLSFYLYNRQDAFHPDSMGSLTVYQTFGRYQRYPVAKFEGSTALNWTQKLVNIGRTSRDYNVTFEVTKGDHFYSDMAIDDVKLEDMYRCQFTDKCTGLNAFKCECVSGGSPFCLTYDTIVCDFADVLFACGYKDESNPNDGAGWNAYITASSEQVKVINGMFVMDKPMTTDTIKRLVSPIVTSQPEVCMSVSYKIRASASSYCVMTIYQELADSRTLLKTVGGSDESEGNTWHQAYMTLSPGQHSQISYQATCSHDDSVLTTGVTNITTFTSSCEHIFAHLDFFCVFNATMCGFLDISKDASNWIPTSRGVKSGLPRSAPVQESRGVLLSPTFTTPIPTCIMFRGRSTQFATASLTLRDYADPRQVYHYTVLPHDHHYNIHVRVEPGTRRFILETAVGPGAEVLLEEVGRCEGTPSSPLIVESPELPGERVEGGGTQTPPTDFPRPPDGADNLPKQEPIPDLSTYYQKAGHQLTNMVYGCRFAGRLCSTVNFTSAVTDFGLCHTFNPAGYPALLSASTGSSSGLSLVLNIEQYDYMTGPQHNAGVKVFVYDSTEVPLIRDQGFAVGPGLHALVGITLSKSTSLPKPWGTCGEKQLKYRSVYSASACIQECETDFMVDTCGCRDAYMPGENTQSPPICNVSTYLNCLVDQLGQFGSEAENCPCTEPCERKIYETQISYAELSTMSVNQILSTDVAALNQSHLTALEANQRTNPDRVTLDLKHLHHIVNAYSTLIQFVFTQAWAGPTSIFIRIERSLKTFLTEVVQGDYEKLTGETLVPYIRAFNQEYGSVRETIKLYSHKVIQDVEVLSRLLDQGADRDDILNIVNPLKISLSVLKDALIKYRQSSSSQRSLYDSNFNGKTFVPDIFFPDRMNIESGVKCEQETSTLRTLLEVDLKTSLDDISGGSTPVARAVNTSEGIIYFVEQTIFTTEGFLRDIYSHHESLKRTLPVVFRCVDEYYHFLLDMDKNKTWMLDAINRNIDSLHLARPGASVNDVLDFYKETDSLLEQKLHLETLLQRYTRGEISKLNLAQEFTSDKLADLRQELSLFRSHVTSTFIGNGRKKISNTMKLAVDAYTRSLHDQLAISKYFTRSKLVVKEFNLWRRPQADLAETYLVHYGRDTYKFGDLEHLIDVYMYKVLTELLDWYSQPLHSELTHFEARFLSLLNDLRASLTTMHEEALDYHKQTELGPNFIRRNFLSLDIFYSQLKYQNTEQVKTYGVGDFFADVGGFMGLLLGGSIISLFEFADLVLYNSFRKSRHSRENSVKSKGEEAGFASTEKNGGDLMSININHE